MKSASKFEKIAARCWNLLNEGKPFTPIFVLGTMVLFHAAILGSLQAVQDLMFAFIYVIPLLIIYFVFDFPLFLRNYLWIPFVIFIIIWKDIDIGLLLFSMALYFFLRYFLGDFILSLENWDFLVEFHSFLETCIKK